MTKEYKYDVALSFAGKDRQYVNRVYTYLSAHGLKPFYDKAEEIELWGKDLVARLDEIYRKEARYCVMFISKYYLQKAWPRHERRSALARAITDEGYILPTRFDDSDIPGLPPTIHYIDLRKKSPEKLGELIVQKLSRKPNTQSKEVSEYRLPKMSKSFDPYKESQIWIDYLISELEKRCKGTDISFSSFSREGRQCLRFVLNGKPFYSIDIHLGGFHRDHGLSFSYAQGEMQMSSGYNAWGDFEWDKEKESVVLKLNDFSAFLGSNTEGNFSKKEFLEYIWSKVCDVIEGK
jgi:hypothetical protein